MGSRFRTVYRWHAPLAVFALVTAALAVASALGYVLDGRLLLGSRVWAKPLKFAVSFTVYAGTLAWMISLLPAGRLHRLAHRAGTALALASAFELAVITLQAARGQRSHFNHSTPFDAAVFNAMGALVAVIFVATVVIAIAVTRSPLADRATAWSIRLGLVVSLAGMSVGFLMLRPAPGQGHGGFTGAHSVGVADGGPGLPFVGWSTSGGDLRISHFVGIHALQVLPLVALAVAGRWDAATRLRVVLLTAAAYSGLTGLLLWQALRGQSLVHPDAATAFVFAALMIVAVGGAVVVLQDRNIPVPHVAADVHGAGG